MPPAPPYKIGLISWLARPAERTDSYLDNNSPMAKIGEAQPAHSSAF